MKNCIVCNEFKKIDDYYAHPKTADGHLGKCKECCKIQAKEREHRLRKNPEWAKKERERIKERYHRLGYKERQKEWNEKRPWANKTIYKYLNKKLKIPKGFECHHWSYANDKLTDVIILTSKDHSEIHTHLEIDSDKRIFKSKDTGEYLDTKKKHIEFILKHGIPIIALK